MALPENLLEKLACPQCRGPLEYKQTEKEQLVCNKCKLSYPVSDDIPVLLVDEAEKI